MFGLADCIWALPQQFCRSVTVILLKQCASPKSTSQCGCASPFSWKTEVRIRDFLKGGSCQKVKEFDGVGRAVKFNGKRIKRRLKCISDKYMWIKSKHGKRRKLASITLRTYQQCAKMYLYHHQLHCRLETTNSRGCCFAKLAFR